MADIKIKDPEEIYNLAMKCNDLFSSYLSGRSNHDRAVEGRQQQFWAWATGLGVFAEHDLSLDRKLRDHSDVQELVIRLLDLLRTGLSSFQGLYNVFHFECGFEVFENCLAIFNVPW